MASRAKLGATLALDGEKEYKAALADITAGLKVNYSQMALVAAQYDDAGNSQDALRAKSNALSATMASQREKVELLRAQLEKSIVKNGEGSKTTMQYQASLNRAETELVKMNSQLTAYDAAMHEGEKSTASLADVVNGLTSTLGISLPPAMQGAVDKLDGISASGAAAVGVIAGVVTGLAKMTIATAQTADNLLTLSSTTGISTDALQEFEYASELLDVSSETMQGSMTKMIRSMNTAREGIGGAAEAFSKLHIKISGSNGQLKDANTVFYQTIDALGRVKNETERDALAMEIFGRSARDLNPLIEAGSDRLKELGVEAHNVGYVMSNETLQQFGQLDDAMQRMNTQGEALKNSLALALLPVLTGLFEAISKVPVPVLQTIIVLVTTITTVLLVVKAIKELTSTAKSIKNFFGGFNAQTLKTTAIVLGVVAALIALGTIIAVLLGRSGELNSAMSNIGSAVGQVTASTTSAQTSYPHYAGGTNFHPGGPALVGEYGTEIVELPRGSRVYPHGQNPQATQSQTANVYYYVTIDAKRVKEFNDVVEIAQNEAVSIRKGVNLE